MLAHKLNIAVAGGPGRIVTAVETTSGCVPEARVAAGLIGKKVALTYGEMNPKIIKIKEDTTENDMKPMYLVTIKGNFKKGNLRAPYLSFSMLANGTYVWCIRAYNMNIDKPVPIWEDDEISFH